MTTREPGGTLAGVDRPLGESPAYRTTRRVRLGDAAPGGDARLDAVARYLQDVAADDLRDAGVTAEAVWVVRRTSIRVERRPRYDVPLTLTTWCSGIGAAWAERRTSIVDAGGTLVESSCLWACLDPLTRRPVPPGSRSLAHWGVVDARRVGARLAHPLGEAPPDGDGEVFALRTVDLDVLGHVNNAVAWTAAEAWAATRGRSVTAGEVEYHAPIEQVGELSVATGSAPAPDGAGFVCWRDGSGRAVLSARLVLAG